MKREGRQYGMVRTYEIWSPSLNLRPDKRPKSYANLYDSPATNGLFTKVSTKPTNNSKYTSRCCGPKCTHCHLNPACKSKDKVKGTQKLRSCVTSPDFRLLTWRILNSKPGFWASGLSVNEILDHLDDEEDYVDHDGDEILDHLDEEEDYVDHDGDDNDSMSFCDVGLWWELVEGDEGWFMVGDNVIP